MSKKWTAFFEGDERVPVYDTEGEAIGGMEWGIDGDHEPGEEVEYIVAQMKSVPDFLAEWHERIGERVFEDLNSELSDEMGAEEWPLNMTREKQVELGKLIATFLSEHATHGWHTVDTKTEQKRTYIAGSNDKEQP